VSGRGERRPLDPLAAGRTIGRRFHDALPTIAAVSPGARVLHHMPDTAYDLEATGGQVLVGKVRELCRVTVQEDNRQPTAELKVVQLH
jgi:hypothetical protein